LPQTDQEVIGLAALNKVTCNYNITYKPTNLKEQLAMTTISPYDVIGGEQAILSLVDRFYFYMCSNWQRT